MNSKETNKNPAQEGIFDARQLGAPKMLILGCLLYTSWM